MNESIKKKWVEALRSGKYRQGAGRLRSLDNEFCCLGVLCDVVKDEVAGRWDDIFFIDRSGEASNAILPIQIAAMARLDRSPMAAGQTLTVLNDTGKHFSEIADLIEKHL